MCEALWWAQGRTVTGNRWPCCSPVNDRATSGEKSEINNCTNAFLTDLCYGGKVIESLILI